MLGPVEGALPQALLHRGFAHRERLPRPGTRRLAGLGLAIVLLLLTCFGFWVAFATDRSSHRLQGSFLLSSDYERARYAVASEESLERKYRLEPGPDVRALFDQASASLQSALAAVRREGAPDDRALVDRVLAAHEQYLSAIDRMFAAVDANEPGRVLAIDHRLVDPVFYSIERRVDAQASAHQQASVTQLANLRRSSTIIMIATPLTFAAGLALLGLFSMILLAYRRRVEEVGKRELFRKAKEQQRLLQHTVRSAEEERTRIAGELHDGPIQHLTALDYRLESIKTRKATALPEPVDESLERAQEWLRQDISELRQMMGKLRLPVLDQWGLAAALRSHADTLTRETSLECTVDCRLEEDLDPTTETMLYRVAQEALTNVVKHARAHRAKVSLDRRDGSIRLVVDDDGQGFDPAPAGVLAEQGHFGLVGMRERVEMAGGRFELESERGAGTRVRVELPCHGALA